MPTAGASSQSGCRWIRKPRAGRPCHFQTADDEQSKGRWSRPPQIISNGLRGFTLVEVLVALCIFAMAVVVLGASYLNVLISYETVSRGTQVNEDFAFARELVLREPDREKLEQGGEFETATGQRAAWSVEITSTTVPNVFNVAFTCQIDDPKRTEPDKVVQQFTVLRPTWVIDPAERDKLKADIKTRIYELQGKKLQ
jgi:general secretion pathway protein I